MGTLSSALNAAGSQRHARVAAEAVRLLEEGGAGPEDLVAAYARMAGSRWWSGTCARRSPGRTGRPRSGPAAA
jgi:hypothetical protein